MCIVFFLSLWLPSRSTEDPNVPSGASNLKLGGIFDRFCCQANLLPMLWKQQTVEVESFRKTFATGPGIEKSAGPGRSDGPKVRRSLLGDSP